MTWISWLRVALAGLCVWVGYRCVRWLDDYEAGEEGGDDA
jgi:hypothetical protein